MKKLLCLLICALLALGACALAEGQLPLAASLEAYLPSVGHPFTASDEDFGYVVERCMLAAASAVDNSYNALAALA